MNSNNENKATVRNEIYINVLLDEIRTLQKEKALYQALLIEQTKELKELKKQSEQHQVDINEATQSE